MRWANYDKHWTVGKLGLWLEDRKKIILNGGDRDGTTADSTLVGGPKDQFGSGSQPGCAVGGGKFGGDHNCASTWFGTWTSNQARTEAASAWGRWW